jgi:hypothetical protein
VTPRSAAAWREIRVFISSTFKDMQAERDHLVRFVFPRLREELLKRRIHFVDIDLRWGVTADQDAFDLCMDEIERCRPRFICMLGGRYGWVPPPRSVPRDFLGDLLAGRSVAGDLTADQQASVTDLYELDEEESVYVLREKPRAEADVQTWSERVNAVTEILRVAGRLEVEDSITASEILHGALDEERLARPTYRYFYFRDPPVPDGIPAELIGDYREEPGSSAASALRRIKDDIRGARGQVETAPGQIEELPLPVYEYPCRWDPATERVVDLEEFGDRVYEDLLESVNAELGLAPPGALDPLEEEHAATEAFIETRLGRYRLGEREPVERYVVGSRASVFEALQAHVEQVGGNGCLCLVGPPGSGKSALIGKFYREHAERAGADPRARDEVLIAHFAGVNATGTRELLGRLCHELVAGAALPDVVPTNYDGLREAFPELLAKAADTKHVVILIDAINQLDPMGREAPMVWLPDQLPEHARIVLTAIEGPALDALRARPEPPVELPLRPLSRTDAVAIIDAFLERYRKDLAPDQLAELLSKEDARKPLYLLTALEELRTLGTYGEITDRIRELPGQIEGLFAWMLRRLEDDEGFRDQDGRPVGRDLVQAYCSYLALGRVGMAQAELVDLVAPGDGGRDGTADAQGNVAALERLLRPYLMRRGGLIDFAHGQFRAAVEARYLDHPTARRRSHEAIGELFLARGFDYTRTLTELTYHLAEASSDDALIDVMTSEFPDTKLRRTGLAADVARDFILALNASARRDDLAGSIRFGLDRSALWSQANAITYPAVSWLLGENAAADRDLGPVRRAEALVREFVDDEARLCVSLSALAGGVGDRGTRERLLDDAYRMLTRLPGGEERDQAALVFLAGALQGMGYSPERVSRVYELPLSGDEARVQLACLRAADLWRAGDDVGAGGEILSAAIPEWEDLAPTYQEEVAQAAVAVWHGRSPASAAKLIGFSTTGSVTEESFHAAMDATRVGRQQWLEAAMRHVRDPGWIFPLGFLALIAVARDDDSALDRRVARFQRAEDRANAVLARLLRLLPVSGIRQFANWDVEDTMRYRGEGLVAIPSLPPKNVDENLVSGEPENHLAVGLAIGGANGRMNASRNPMVRVGELLADGARADASAEVESALSDVLSTVQRQVRHSPIHQTHAADLLCLASASVELRSGRVAREAIEEWIGSVLTREAADAVRSIRWGPSLLAACFGWAFLLIALGLVWGGLTGFYPELGPIATAPKNEAGEVVGLVVGLLIMGIEIVVVVVLGVRAWRRRAAARRMRPSTERERQQRRSALYDRLREAASLSPVEYFDEVRALVERASAERLFRADEIRRARSTLGAPSPARRLAFRIFAPLFGIIVILPVMLLVGTVFFLTLFAAWLFLRPLQSRALKRALR